MKKLSYIIAIASLCLGRLSAQYNLTPAGLIKGARLEYVSGNTVKIGVGYGEILGAYWEIGSTDALATTGYTLTGLSATAGGSIQYVYIDRAHSSLPTISIRNSTTTPSWNDTFMGWYNNSDRCIGALWIKPDGSIGVFICPEDSTYLVDGYQFVASGSVSTTDTTTAINGSSYLPVNAYEARLDILAYWSGSGTAWSYLRVGILTGGSTGTYAVGTTRAQFVDWIGFMRGDKTIYWQAWASSNSGTAWLNVRGYRLER